MTDLERKNDPHRAIVGEVSAQECVEHMVAAKPTFPANAIPTVVLPENVACRRKSAHVSHNASNVL